MSKNQMQSQQNKICWVGLDWGVCEHAVSVVDDARGKVAQFKVRADLAGLDELHERLEGAGAIRGIAIEAGANLVAPFLCSKGYTLYLVNPKLSKNWREGNSVAGVKSDARDGHVLAVELARRHESLRPLEQPDPAAAELAALCETVRGLIERRTALLQQLKAMLRRYYPAALDFFSNWGSPAAWRFIKQFPRPEKLAKAQKQTLYRFLKRNRIGLSPRWIERVEQAGRAADWPTPSDSLACEVMALSVAAQLDTLQKHIDKCDRMIAERVKRLAQTEIIESLPGAGARLAPAMTAMSTALPSTTDRLQAMRCLSGTAPVENASGAYAKTRMRRRCNKYWRNLMHLYARSSIRYCPWARAYYELCRERGDKYATALRKLADKWLKIIHRMLATNKPYDEQRYINALRKAGSPVYKRLCEKPCG